MREIKPCPFCGSECVAAAYLFNPEPKKIYRVMCIDCGVRTDFFKTKNQAYKLWNTRTSSCEK